MKRHLRVHISLQKLSHFIAGSFEIDGTSRPLRRDPIQTSKNLLW